MGKVEVQNVKFVPPEWYDERERFEKRSNRMFDEINKFVTETRGDIEQMQGEVEATKLSIEASVEASSKATDEKLDRIATSLGRLSIDVETYMKAHTEQHENEKGILKKIFGR
jgi:hypothetical protein